MKKKICLLLTGPSNFIRCNVLRLWGFEKKELVKSDNKTKEGDMYLSKRDIIDEIEKKLNVYKK